MARAAEQAAAADAPPRHSLGLIRNCSAALPPSLGSRLEAVLPGASVLPTYAMTEALPICSNRPTDASRDLCSVGPAAGPEVAVAAVSGELVHGEEEGEVLVRGACVFSGYETREHSADANAAAFHAGGWLRTGDRGWVDGEGHFRLSGRFKEVCEWEVCAGRHS